MLRKVVWTTIISLILVLSFSLFPAPVPIQAATFNFTVDVTADTSDANLGDNICADAQNDCSLRAALEQSKPLTVAGHTVNIYFNLPSPTTIVLTSDLPLYTQANLINNNPANRITINGNNNFGLVISGNQSTTIEGLIFMNFRLAPVYVYFGGTDFIKNNVFIHNENGLIINNLNNGEEGIVHVTGNYVGYDPYTETRNANTKGIQIKDVATVYTQCEVWIGGNNAEDGNVIAGNAQSGLYIENTNQNTDIFVFNNYIGMVDDTTPEPNNNHGIEVIKSSGILNIGGDYLTQGNLISANKNIGVYIAESSYASILGNTFSANAAGNAYIPNENGDLKAFDSAYLSIGGSSTEYGNVIPQGISVESDSVNNVNLTIKNNFLGISRSGFVFPVSVDQDGIWIENATGFPDISFNEITNFDRGIVILWDSIVPISKNKIYGNRVMGIDLDDDGVTLNDPLDVDTGPNGMQNFPVISNLVLQDFGDVKIIDFDVSLHSEPNKNYYVEVFQSPFCGANGYGQGKQILTWSGAITTDSSGNSNIWHLQRVFPTNIQYPCLTATATLMNGTSYVATSEFSQGVMAWQPEKLFLPLILK